MVEERRDRPQAYWLAEPETFTCEIPLVQAGRRRAASLRGLQAESNAFTYTAAVNPHKALREDAISLRSVTKRAEHTPVVPCAHVRKVELVCLSNWIRHFWEQGIDYSSVSFGPNQPRIVQAHDYARACACMWQAWGQPCMANRLQPLISVSKLEHLCHSVAVNL